MFVKRCVQNKVLKFTCLLKFYQMYPLLTMQLSWYFQEISVFVHPTAAFNNLFDCSVIFLFLCFLSFTLLIMLSVLIDGLDSNSIHESGKSSLSLS